MRINSDVGGKMKKISLSVPVLIVLFLISTTAVATPKIGGTLTYGRASDAVTLDPHMAEEFETFTVVANIFDGLVNYKKDSTEVVPALATSWETSKDGKQWTFHLRKNVLFHDSTPFDAQAVVFNFLRLLDPNHPYYRSDFPYTRFTFQYVKEVKALDQYTVQIVLERPYAPFLANLAMPAARIVSPAAVRKWGDNFTRHPVGTGPFIFQEWVQRDHITLIRNDRYWGQKPYLDKLIFRCIPDKTERYIAFQNDQIQIMDNVDPADIAQLKKLKDKKIKMQPGLNISYIAMNTQKKPFDSRLVRQAVNHAVNKKKLIKLFYKGLAIPAKNPIPPTIWSYNDKIQDYEYNPQKAKTLLQKAGYTQGLKISLWSMRNPRPYMPDPQHIAQVIKANLEAVGMEVDLRLFELKAYWQALNSRAYDMCLLGWVSDNGDPDNFLYVLLDKTNAIEPDPYNNAFFVHDQLHELLVKAQQIIKTEQRARLYKQAQEIIHHECPWVPLAHLYRIIALDSRVHGPIIHPTNLSSFNTTWIE